MRLIVFLGAAVTGCKSGPDCSKYDADFFQTYAGDAGSNPDCFAICDPPAHPASLDNKYVLGCRFVDAGLVACNAGFICD